MTNIHGILSSDSKTHILEKKKHPTMNVHQVSHIHSRRDKLYLKSDRVCFLTRMK